MKDAKGHGSNPHGGSGEAAVHGIAAQHGVPTDHLSFSVNPTTGPTPDQKLRAARAMYGGPTYSREAVNNAIAASNRAGHRVSGKEAKAIHALLKGRH